MIIYSEHKNIDKKKWDECILNSVNSLIYANSWYLDIASPKWDAIIIDDYRAVFPLPQRNKLGVNYVYQPFFIQQLGLFYSDKKYSGQDYVEKCIKCVPEKFKLIDIYLNEANYTSSDSLLNTQNRRNYILDLSPGYKALYKNYSKGLKAKLNQFEKLNLFSEDSHDPYEVIQLFLKEKKEGKLQEEDILRLKKIINDAINRNLCFIKTVKQNDFIIAGAVFLIFKNRITYLFSASSEEGKKTGAMSHILNQVIKKYSGQPYIFDFEGSMVESIAKFFRSFGSTESVYLHLKINRLPKAIRWIKE